jgi:predicted nucleic acid-binding protein
LDDNRGGVSVQVLQEFFVQATRATRPDRLPQEVATGLIRTWLRFPVQDITVPILLDALELESKHGFSHWDSAVVASARALGCKQLYSEDMDHGRDVGGVVIINPFK